MFSKYPKIEKLIELGIGDETEDSLILSKFDEMLAYELGILEKAPEMDEKLMEYYKLYKELYDKGYIPKTTVYEGKIYFRVASKGYLRKKRKTQYLVALEGDILENLKIATMMKKKLVMKINGRFVFLTYHKFP